MQEKDTIARPYAKAIFNQAQAENTITSWDDALSMLTTVIEDKQISSLLSNPQVAKEDSTALVLSVVTDEFSKTQQNMVKLLAANNRLAYVSQIKKRFEVLKARADKLLEVEVISAYKLDAKAEQDLAKVLEKRLNSKVNIKTALDKDLIGGVVIKAGDMVIDSSVRGQINQLAVKISA